MINWSLIQFKLTSTVLGTSSVVTLDNQAGVGDRLLVAVVTNKVTDTPSVTDTAGTTYTAIGSVLNSAGGTVSSSAAIYLFEGVVSAPITGLVITANNPGGDATGIAVADFTAG
jgi:uncharacterized membrane protein